MNYLYDQKTKKYIGMSIDKPIDNCFTEVEPSEANIQDVWYLRIYQPETNTWRDWDPFEYEKWLESQKPQADDLFKMDLLAQVATLNDKINKIEGGTPDVSTN
ncbi:putative phage tail fiber protein [Weissella oryzae SG25]|uniref:Putative phage tail fiber protein n=1 Tax=Weissella oryzae (strain DSM 25784 / JCM 18191 / LMG 30913 / SG25) TaxID=1329250 RepID=A0A069D0X2_WEIOS|nr:hypothetical protein [Weissella oryzae]GAK30996.1 putative phage tail fiber protein [Weissella oryzae SG25]